MNEEAGGPELARAIGCHPLIAQILLRRGIATTEAATRFLSPSLSELPDPALLLGMEGAVERIIRAIDSGEQITAYGDYDVDGVTSTVLLVSFLRACGAKVDYYVPHRLGEGYGLNMEAVATLAARGTSLLISLDCGVTAVAEIEEAIRLGVDVVVVDHHQTPPQLPRAAAIINPWQDGCTFPTKELCAVGVTFMLCAGLRRSLRDRGFFASRREPNLKAYLDLVALGTVADVVPLVGVNRLFVREGLEVLRRSERPGLLALKRVAGLEDGAPITAGHLGFRLGPRINAAGRLDDAGIAVELLLSEDEARARALAEILDQANEERQTIERALLGEAIAQAEAQPGSLGLVLAGDGWHPGVVGIVASRVVSRFHRPTIVIGLDPETGLGKGSARSIPDFHVFDALSKCSEHLVRYGGHEHAAGITIERSSLEAFRAAFSEEAQAQLEGLDLGAICTVDGTLDPGDVGFALCEELERLAPFGAGNPEPVLSLQGVRASGRIVGRAQEGPGHLKLSLAESPFSDGIGFGLGDRLGLLSEAVDLAFTLGFNDYRGERRVQLNLRDVRPARSGGRLGAAQGEGSNAR